MNKIKYKNTLIFITMIIIAELFIAPILIVFMNSFKSNQ